MRTLTLFNDDWIFEKEGREEAVSLPHTWNAKDGTDGGNDYYRGACTYRKRFWLEFHGAAMTAEV